MKKTFKLMSILFISGLTMTLFSFKNPGTNETLFKSVNVTTYDSALNPTISLQRKAVGVVKVSSFPRMVLERASRDLVLFTATATVLSNEQNTDQDNSNKSASLLNAL